MKYTEGFTKVIPIALTVVCHGICFVALAVALKSLPISNVYAILAGVGTAIMALVGLMMFNEPMQWQKVLATGMIVIGVVILNISGDHESSADATLANKQTEPPLIEAVEAIDSRIEALPYTAKGLLFKNESSEETTHQTRHSG